MYRPIRQATHSSTSGLLIPSNNSPTPSLLYIISSLLTTSPPSVSATKSCAHSTNQSGSHYYSPSSVSSVISSMRVITEYSTTSPHRRPTCAPFNSTNLTFRAPRFYLSANSATNTTLSFPYEHAGLTNHACFSPTCGARSDGLDIHCKGQGFPDRPSMQLEFRRRIHSTLYQPLFESRD